MYYWVDPDTGFFMLDGDRISSLNASFIGDLVRSAGLEDDLRIGVVQTAYANGASTTYIEKHLQLPVVFTPTGVKHLHHAACQFDIGVYFEANGHGTVVFSQEAMRTFREKEPQSPAQKDALETLAAVGDLINQTVGDAITVPVRGCHADHGVGRDGHNCLRENGGWRCRQPGRQGQGAPDEHGDSFETIPSRWARLAHIVHQAVGGGRR